VPVLLVGRHVRVHLHASHLVVYDDRTEVARHERLMAKGRTRLDLDHYLEALLRKPGALPGSTALEQARSAGRFTPVHDAWWEAVRKTHGGAAGTRALVEVLLLHRHMSHEHVVAGLATALQAGASPRTPSLCRPASSLRPTTTRIPSIAESDRSATSSH
jgi:Mu transposase-like protein